jgi:hypothetical protein
LPFEGRKDKRKIFQSSGDIFPPFTSDLEERTYFLKEMKPNRAPMLK